MIATASIVAAKELRECARDVRSLIAAVAVTIVGPLVAGVAVGRTGSGGQALAVFLLVSTFIAGMSVAIDITAGERERRSLEPLLLTQADPLAIAGGKWAATAVANVCGFLLTLACGAGVFLYVAQVNPRATVPPPGLLAIHAPIAAVPLALLASALQVTIATNARTAKEGQTYLSLLLFVPMVSGMLLAFSRATPPAWHLLVPVLGQHQVLAALIRGEVPSPAAALTPALVAVVLSVLLVRRAAVFFTRERIIFGR